MPTYTVSQKFLCKEAGEILRPGSTVELTEEQAKQYPHLVALERKKAIDSAQPYVPADLERLCIEVAKRDFRATEGVQSESLGTWRRTYNVEKAEEWIEKTIALYRRFAI